jgi:hypothetical protein
MSATAACLGLATILFIIVISTLTKPRIHPLKDIKQHRKNQKSFRETREKLLNETFGQKPHEGTMQLLFPKGHDDKS